MAKSTYISQFLNQDQIEFLRQLDDQEIEYFSLQGIENQLDNVPPNLNEVVENLSHKGLLNRIERGKYTRPNFKDPNVLGTFITQGNSAVAYWSALHQHNLTDRFPERVFIKTTRRKESKRVFGVHLQYVFVTEEKFFGVEEHGYGNLSFPITDLEMTIVDCFHQPRYAGPFPDLLTAFYRAELNPLKLIEYVHNLGNESVMKRIGYLAELLKGEALKSFVDFALKQVNPRYVRFNVLGNDKGEFNSRWKLRMNLSSDDIYNILQTPY